MLWSSGLSVSFVSEFSTGKKHMNQLMTFLDKNNVKDTLSGRSDTALRSVRAKREAEEAGLFPLLPKFQ